MTDDLAEARLAVAQASRILAMEGVVDAFGHATMRHPHNPDLFVMSRTCAPGMVTPGDVVILNMDCESVDRPGERLFLERFLHAELYRSRPDVMGIVHSHSTDVVPFTIVPGAKVEPVCHICGFLRDTSEPFDVADHAGPASDLLISSPELGKHFADHMGGTTVGLMRAHGFTSVGKSLEEAVFNAIYTARNCKIYLNATRLGTPSALTQAEAITCEEMTIGQADRAWNLWVYDLRRTGYDPEQ